MVGFLVGDLIGRIREGVKKRKKCVYFYNTKYIKRILELLCDRGVILMYCVLNVKYLKIYLMDNLSLVLRISVVSKPGHRIYRSGKFLLNKYNYKCYYPIVTNSSGIFISRHLLNKGKVLGGEFIFLIIGF